MILHFIGGATGDVKVTKIGRKYMYIYCLSNRRKYRVNMVTGEIQDGTYFNTYKGMYVSEK